MGGKGVWGLGHMGLGECILVCGHVCGVHASVCIGVCVCVSECVGVGHVDVHGWVLCVCVCEVGWCVYVEG